MKRYDIGAPGGCHVCDGSCNRGVLMPSGDPTGEWVRYKDVRTEVERHKSAYETECRASDLARQACGDAESRLSAATAVAFDDQASPVNRLERIRKLLAAQPAAPECRHCKTYGALCGVHGKRVAPAPQPELCPVCKTFPCIGMRGPLMCAP